MKIKRTIALLLLASLLVGCGSGGTETKDTTNSDTVTTAGDTTTEEESSGKWDKPSVEAKDYGGRDFNVLASNYRAHELYFFSDGENGDTLNDAVYKRNSAVEDKLNIKIKSTVFGDITTIYPAIQKSVMAGSPDYDLALTHSYEGISWMIGEQLLYNWNAVDTVDLTKNYWNQNMNDTLSVNGVLPVVKSEYMPPEVFVILFNKKIQDDYKLDDYYQVVKDGKWTLDYFVSEVSKVSDDLNGDGKYDINDRYGLAGLLDANFQAFLNGCDLYAVSKDDDGRLVINQPNERFVNMYSKIYSLVYDGHSTYTFRWADRDSDKAMKFENNQALFFFSDTNSIDTLRSMEADFGILPFPKYDEEQENYRTLSMSGFLALPASAGDKDFSGTVTEYLSYYSAEMFMPVFYDTLLGNKYIRDNESSEMLDIIFENIVFDPAMVYGAYNEISYSMMNLIVNKNKDVMSYFKARTNSNQKVYDKVYESFMNYNS